MKIIDENILNEMARIGFIQKDKYEIWIRTNDPGNKPHMHIWDSGTRGQEFHCCVRLDVPEYFIHEGKEDILNSNQRKELIKFLKAPYRRFGITNWERVLIEWNDNNSNLVIDENSEMPDYKKLPIKK